MLIDDVEYCSLSLHLSSDLAITMDSPYQNLLTHNKRLRNAISRAETEGIPAIQVSPAHGRQLSILCQLMQAKSVLEIGTLAGYSTIWLAESVPGIKVTSIDHNPKHRSIAEVNLRGLDNVDLRLGSALDILPDLQASGAVFDFVLIDADWENQHLYFDWAVKMTRKGGCIYVDNVVRKITEGVERKDPDPQSLIEQVKGDSRVTATLLSALGSRNVVDGYILALVK
ncbi:S-adenosyl-L-methionine-dependent methyltransferase [Pseudovirgaria hyperparasitica]|uniref:S-adenosyl-L-methionine-dependent methyltransferase n=1 Tax=Pseudovirgaria hyperparasitica TaxID=470096 RepID=A0A6A6WBI8_9PEZI|nr:S-adenosyl-L-methionine-dependent methyltransferase [Pseudovirgaria hyperparasitica]KAF2758967.1 S-adenosyl-L-methionine-dependent methyltransferase [Pseudovirgaria hyperparasitica]